MNTTDSTTHHQTKVGQVQFQDVSFSWGAVRSFHVRMTRELTPVALCNYEQVAKLTRKGNPHEGRCGTKEVENFVLTFNNGTKIDLETTNLKAAKNAALKHIVEDIEIREALANMTFKVVPSFWMNDQV